MKIKKIKFALPISIIFIGAAFFLFKPASAKAATLPSLPAAYVDTTMPASASTCTVTLPQGGDLQATINAATLGDTICLQAGSIFTGTLTLPNKTSGSGWVTIRTTDLAGLPAPGNRVSPANAGAMSKIRTIFSDPAVRAQKGAHHYRFIGIEMSAEISGTVTNYGIVELGYGDETVYSDLPHHIVFDRVYVHGSPTCYCKKGLALNGANQAIIDSYVADVHSIGQETHAIDGWNGPGPFKITNNYLEASGINILFGGATPAFINVIPSDIEIKNNYLFKPQSWWPGSPTYAGTPWEAKNLLEFKNGQRVLIEGNVMENSWASSQIGWAIIFNFFDEPSLGGINDITFRNNIIRHAAYGIDIRGRDIDISAPKINRVLVQNNLFEDISRAYSPPEGGIFGYILSGPADIVYDHNTAFHERQMFSTVTASGSETSNLVVTNNIFNYGEYGFFGDGGYIDTAGLEKYTRNYVYTKNAIVNMPYYANLPAGNLNALTYSDVGFVNYNNGQNGDYHLSASSPYKNAGTDGKDIGADMDVLLAATATAVTGSGNTQPPSDTTPPVISSITSTNITQSGAIIAWTTNELADTQVEYGPTTAYGQSSSLNTSLLTIHSVAVSSLTANSLYHFRVKSRDAAGNIAISTDQTFTTQAVPVPGDLNLDHIVNSVDSSLLNSKWLQQYAPYDLQVDGLINSLDFGILSSNWGRTW